MQNRTIQIRTKQGLIVGQKMSKIGKKEVPFYLPLFPLRIREHRTDQK